MPIETQRTAPGIDADIYSLCSGTDSTLSNLPGAGRVMGNLISKGGRRIEALAGTIATRLGYGPTATFLRIIFPRDLACSEHRRLLDLRRFHFERLRRTPSIETLFDYLCSFGCCTCRVLLCDAILADLAAYKDARELQDHMIGTEASAQVLAIEYITLLLHFHPPLSILFAGFLVNLETAKRRVLLQRPYDPQAAQCVSETAEWSLITVKDGPQNSSIILLAALDNSSPFGDNVDAISTLWKDSLNHTLENLVGKRLPLLVLFQIRVASNYRSGYDVASLDAFPTRAIVSNLVARCFTTDRAVERGTCLKVLDTLHIWISEAAYRRYWWHRAAGDFWTPLLEWRLQSQADIEGQGWRNSKRMQMPWVLESGLVEPGRDLIRLLAPGYNPGESFLDDLLRILLFEIPGGLPLPLKAWVGRLLKALTGGEEGI